MLLSALVTWRVEEERASLKDYLLSLTNNHVLILIIWSSTTMPRKSRTPYAILGALSHGPKSGYDISCFFEQNRMFFWSESYGQIYPTLKRLLDDGLVDVEVEERDQGPERKVYSITQAGNEHLQEWLDDDSLKSSVRDEFLLKLHFATAEAKPTIIERLQSLEESLSAELELLHDQGSDAESDGQQGQKEVIDEAQALYRQLTLDWAQQFHQAKLDWCQSALKQLGARKKSKSSGGKKKKKKKGTKSKKSSKS